MTTGDPSRPVGDGWPRWSPGDLVLRCVVEGVLAGGVLGSLVAAALLTSAIGRDMRRLGETPGPELVVAALAQGPLLGLLPGALMGLVMGVAYLLFTALTLRLCRDPSWAWTVIGAVTVTPMILVTAAAGPEPRPWPLLLLLWTAALTLYVRARMLSRGKRPARVADLSR